MEKKTYIWYESRFWVILYALVTLVIMTIQFILGIFEIHEITFHNQVINEFVNGNLNLPMEVMSWVWTALISFYCGSDRLVDIAKTTKLAVGQTSMGDLKKIRGMILISLILFITAVIFNFLTDKNYTLSAYASAFGMTIISYVVGNKAVKASAYFGTREDQNEDGIPDEAEESYKKWKRDQIKNEIEPQYITWEYFLDDPENEYWEKKYRPETAEKED